MTDVTVHPNELAHEARQHFNAAMAKLKELHGMGYTILVAGNNHFGKAGIAPVLEISRVYKL